jgi:hypothetical protein
LRTKTRAGEFVDYSQAQRKEKAKNLPLFLCLSRRRRSLLLSDNILIAAPFLFRARSLAAAVVPSRRQRRSSLPAENVLTRPTAQRANSPAKAQKSERERKKNYI